MSIKFNQNTQTFYLEGKNISYVFRINEVGFAEHLYFGKTIGEDEISYLRCFGGRSCVPTVPGKDGFFYSHYAPEISFFGTGDYREPTVCVTNDLGDRLCELLYESYEIVPEKPAIKGMPSLKGGETLVLHLLDKITGFGADLYYTVYDDCPVIARRIVYKNNSKKTIRLDRAYSFALSIPKSDFVCLTLEGAWGCERHIQKAPMHKGVVSIDSKRTSSSAVLNPFMALLSPDATEESGEAIGVNLVYSSSFVLKAEGSPDGKTLLLGGINDFDFSWELGAGEEFATPEAVIAYSDNGIGQMSRAFHDAYRKYLINPNFVNKERPIVINNWEGTYFDFDNDKLKSIAKAVEGTGIDTFVLDDGWFGKRNDDSSGLGDWVVNTRKLEGGLKTIIDYVHSLGMKFGLWFEPEMVNEDSDLFRAHPDYAIGVPNRARCYTRHQYMLDLTRQEVRDYIVEAINKVLKENEIDYVKWDYNRNVTESFSLGLSASSQKEFAHRYVLGVYDICERIVGANPHIFFEGCSSGGARFDPAMLYYFPQIWTSDDSDAEERTKIQYGTSMVYPLSTMSCHVSIVPNHQTHRVTDVKTRADIAHLGATGYELDTSDFGDEQRLETKAQVEEFRAMQNLVLSGDLYRIENPFESNFFGFMVVSKDKTRADLTLYRRLTGANNRIKLVFPKGLDETKKYYIPEMDKTLCGSTIMNAGLVPEFELGDFKTVKYHFIEK
ncbi:MAG: alpha-galactosidase [Ruminococcaceae bacterium]|nr:alpha-galactosidase [Oscillospiraceae bacterium]